MAIIPWGKKALVYICKDAKDVNTYKLILFGF